jgi:hypothetical protein
MEAYSSEWFILGPRVMVVTAEASSANSMYTLGLSLNFFSKPLPETINLTSCS